MKTDLKSEIIITARKLFYEVGYNRVSMRDVAEALQISVGNLTYHFKKKEDLIEAVVVDQHKNYKKVQAPKTLEELDQFFYRIISHKNQHQYYFRHYAQLAELCPRVYEIQMNVMKDTNDIFKETFSNLKESGFLYSELPDSQTENIIQILMIVFIHGVSHFERLQNKTVTESVLASLWSVIFLCLSEEGKDIYQNIEKNHALVKAKE